MKDKSTQIVLWLSTAAAGATAWWSSSADAAEVLALPARPVQGSRLDAVVEPPPPAGERESAGRLTVDGLELIPFEDFTFNAYDPPEVRSSPEPLTAEAFPESIRGDHEKRVAVEGYVLAADMRRGKISNLVLSRFPPGCCFGNMPVLDEWIAVTCKDGGTEPFSTYLPVVVLGRLEIGEQIDEHGNVESLYRMTDAVVQVEE